MDEDAAEVKKKIDWTMSCIQDQVSQIEELEMQLNMIQSAAANQAHSRETELRYLDAEISSLRREKSALLVASEQTDRDVSVFEDECLMLRRRVCHQKMLLVSSFLPRKADDQTVELLREVERQMISESTDRPPLLENTMSLFPTSPLKGRLPVGSSVLSATKDEKEEEEPLTPQRPALPAQQKLQLTSPAPRFERYRKSAAAAIKRNTL